ncbi:MAG: hypothetical protein RL141_784 [Candidatus Parcubacteria bacterium]|jgi:hypothetical protein
MFLVYRKYTENASKTVDNNVAVAASLKQQKNGHLAVFSVFVFCMCFIL